MIGPGSETDGLFSERIGNCSSRGGGLWTGHPLPFSDCAWCLCVRTSVVEAAVFANVFPLPPPRGWPVCVCVCETDRKRNACFDLKQWPHSHSGIFPVGPLTWQTEDTCQRCGCSEPKKKEEVEEEWGGLIVFQKKGKVVRKRWKGWELWLKKGSFVLGPLVGLSVCVHVWQNASRKQQQQNLKKKKRSQKQEPVLY